MTIIGYMQDQQCLTHSDTCSAYGISRNSWLRNLAMVLHSSTKPTTAFLKRFLLTNRMTQVEQIKKILLVGKLSGERVILPSSDPARDLNNQSRFGTILTGGKVQLSLLEAVYLEEKEKISVVDGRGKKLSHEQLITKGKAVEKAFWIKYCVYRDLRGRGYIVKTALKFGADFRVYDRGVKPGEDHARWIVYPVHEGAHMTWYEFSAKNRVAHSTKKRLLLGIVDEESDVTYYEVSWKRP
jgi:tRNA-intron endonuclease